MNIAMVSAASLGLAAPHEMAQEAEVTNSSPTPPTEASIDANPEGGQLEAAPASSDQTPASSASSEPATAALARNGDARVDSKDETERRGAKSTAGGDPAAESALLTQIARCLPPEMRPRLPAHTLVLEIASNGALAAAPTIESTVPLLTAKDRAAADRVVQAALQCGPYAKPDAVGEVVSLAVDFSAIRPVAAALTGRSSDVVTRR
jgi:hypothetical protein